MGVDGATRRLEAEANEWAVVFGNIRSSDGKVASDTTDTCTSSASRTRGISSARAEGKRVEGGREARMEELYERRW